MQATFGPGCLSLVVVCNVAVRRLVVHFLKYSSPTLSMKTLRVFAFNERTTTPQTGKKDADKLMSVNQDVVIAENQNGGLIALKET